jgi:hypothetical protein
MKQQKQHDKKMKEGKEKAEQTIKDAYDRFTKKEREARIRAAEGIGYY